MAPLAHRAAYLSHARLANYGLMLVSPIVLARVLTVEDFGRKLVKGGAFIDVKAAHDARALQAAGYRVWRL